MGPEQDALTGRPFTVDPKGVVVSPHDFPRLDVTKSAEVSDKEGRRSGNDIEKDLKVLMTEYLEYTNGRRHISFQGGISEMAWEVENDPEEGS